MTIFEQSCTAEIHSNTGSLPCLYNIAGRLDCCRVVTAESTCVTMGTTTNTAEEYMNTLKAELERDTFRDEVVAANLAKLKLLARSPQLAPAVYCQDGICLLAEGAFAKNSADRPASSLEAARILANALLLEDRWQQVLAKKGYVPDVLDFYRRPGIDYEFVGGRILFLLTYKSQVDFVSLIESRGLTEAIDSHLSKHASLASATYFSSSLMIVPAMVESLKLLYNLASQHQPQMHFFSTSIISTIGILNACPISSEPLKPPIAQLLHVLAIIDWPSLLNKQEDSHITDCAEILVQLLARLVSSSPAAVKEPDLVPLLTVLRKVVELDHRDAVQLLKHSLLPQDEERDRPLGQSETLASRLLRIQTATGSTVLPEAISGLLFDLSDHDPKQFIHNVGYGHAAGYLMSHKIPVPDDLGADIGQNAARSQAVNPITGQRRDAEPETTGQEMTESEKEREAERLFVLFERLKATGVVNVENPITLAQQSGQFEEDVGSNSSK